MIKWISGSCGLVCMCRVKVNGQVSDDFKVNTGLRYGMHLIPIAFLPIHEWSCEEVERGEMWSGVTTRVLLLYLYHI